MENQNQILVGGKWRTGKCGTKAQGKL